MDNVLAISKIIKRYIKMRGMTIKQVADKLDINYKTFAGLLNRDAVDAYLLLRLSVLLNIDLCWMLQLYSTPQNISFLEQYQMTRMNAETRETERKIVLDYLDRYIFENPDSITDVKNLILKDFNQLFYLLDVLLPEDYIIRIAVERNKEKYYCMPLNANLQTSPFGFFQRGATQFYEGTAMLKKLILERKGEIL